MKSAKRKRCSTNENQEVDSLHKQHQSQSVKTSQPVVVVDPTQYYFNQPPGPLLPLPRSVAYYSDGVTNNNRLSSLAMPPPPAPPPPPPPSLSHPPAIQSTPFDYLNYNAYYQSMYASNAAVAVAAAAAAAAASTHQSYLNYNQFLTSNSNNDNDNNSNNNNSNNSSLVHPNQQKLTASSYLKYNKSNNNGENSKTGDISEEIDTENNNKVSCKY